MIIKEKNIGDLVDEFKRNLEKYKNTKIKCAIIGRSGTGKSSLINAIAGQYVAETGVTETTMSVEEPIAHGGLLFYDLPGCGTSNFPKNEYISKFNLAEFDCLILVTADRFYEDDLYIIDELTKIKKPIFIVRTKIDFSIDRELRKGISEKETYKKIYDSLNEYLKGYRVKGIYLTSADYPLEYDLNNLLEAIDSSLSSFKKDKFIAAINSTSKSILKRKRLLAEKIVSQYALLAATNGLNPIPGLDVSVDMALMVKMSNEIMEIYGLTDKELKFMHEHFSKTQMKLITSKVLQYAAKYGAKEGVMLLLKRVSVVLATKTMSKWIPFVGQAVAATIGFKMTSSIGNDMILDAELIALETLKSYEKSVDTI